MAGRAPKLNKVLINKICKYIEKGMTRKLTCHRVGIQETTFYGWLNEANMINKALEKGKTLTEPMIVEIGDKTLTISLAVLKMELMESVQVSESKYLEKSLDVLEKAIKQNDVQTAKWLLERRCRKEFGNQQTVQVGNVDGEVFKQEVHDKTMEERFLEFEKRLEGVKLGDPKDKEDEE